VWLTKEKPPKLLFLIRCQDQDLGPAKNQSYYYYLLYRNFFSPPHFLGPNSFLPRNLSMSLRDFIDNVAEQGGESEDEEFDETGETKPNVVNGRKQDFDDSSEEESEEDEEAERAVRDTARCGRRPRQLTWIFHLRRSERASSSMKKKKTQKNGLAVDGKSGRGEEKRGKRRRGLKRKTWT
jgi:hypothetical protein